MRHIICTTCIDEKKKEPGTRIVYAATDFEPAEYERVVIGKAKAPKPEQRVRTITLTGGKTPDVVITEQLPLEHFNCDTCDDEIRPGARAAAVSVWVGGREIAPWESEFIEP